jgi:hypothetical protein
VARQAESYCPVPCDAPAPSCVVPGCAERPVAEVHADSYSTALELFRGIRRQKVHTRRSGDERFFVCARHLQSDPRMTGLTWQLLMF